MFGIICVIVATPSSHKYRDISPRAYLTASSVPHSGISEECMVERWMQRLSRIIHKIPSGSSIWSDGSEISKAHSQQTYYYGAYGEIFLQSGRDGDIIVQEGRGGVVRMTGIIGTIVATTIDGQGHHRCAPRCRTPNRMQTNMMRTQRYDQPPDTGFHKVAYNCPNCSSCDSLNQATVALVSLSRARWTISTFKKSKSVSDDNSTRPKCGVSLPSAYRRASLSYSRA